MIEVVKDGPACHLGTDSCFTNTLFENEDISDFSTDALYDLIKGRKESPKEGSYTSYLFEKGIDKILKKVGEECTEVVIAAKGGRQGRDDIRACRPRLSRARFNGGVRNNAERRKGLSSPRATWWIKK